MKTNHPTKKLGDVCDIRIGGTPSRAEKKYWDKGSFLWVSIADMSKSGNIIYDTKEKITELGINNSNVKLIPKGTLIFSFKLSIGKLAFVDQDMYTNEAIAGLVINDSNELDKNYLYYFLSQLTFENTTSAVKGLTLNKEKIKILEIPLPPLEVQKEIVADLDAKFAKLVEMKRLRAEAIVDTEKIMSETLSEIFAEGKEKEWEEKIISDVCGINPVKSELKDFDENTIISFVQMKSVSEVTQSVELEENKKLKDVQGSYTYFKKGDVIFAKVTPCMENGKVAITDNIKNDFGFGSSEFHVLRANKKFILPKYIYQIVRSKYFRELAQNEMTGSSGLKRVPKSFIENFNIYIPSLAEQREIIKRLDALSGKVRELKELQKVQMEDMKKLEKAYLSEVFESN